MAFKHLQEPQEELLGQFQRDLALRIELPHAIDYSGNIRLHRWHRLAQELHIDPDATIQRVDDFARQLADHVPDIRRRMTEEGLTHSIIARVADTLTARAAACRAILRPV